MLLTTARAIGRPFQELLPYFAMERFLSRLSQSPYADRFILKGALMLTVWQASVSRPSRDIDRLGRSDNRVDTLVTMTQEVCRQPVEPDRMVVDAASVEGERITEAAAYAGVRLRRGVMRLISSLKSPTLPRWRWTQSP